MQTRLEDYENLLRAKEEQVVGHGRKLSPPASWVTAPVFHRCVPAAAGGTGSAAGVADVRIDQARAIIAGSDEPKLCGASSLSRKQMALSSSNSIPVQMSKLFEGHNHLDGM